MKKIDDDMLNNVMSAVFSLKKLHSSMFKTCDEVSQGKKITLIVLNKIAKKGNISLATLREELKIAPSTTTSVISSLEENGYIKREIDKNDRRNIDIIITEKGIDYTKKTYNEFRKNIHEYIDYIGVENAQNLIKLISITNEFINERGTNNEKTI